MLGPPFVGLGLVLPGASRRDKQNARVARLLPGAAHADVFWSGPDDLLAADPAATPHRDGDTRLNYSVLRYWLECFAAGDYGRLLEEAQAADEDA
jgi:hypothetical protein